MADIVPIAAGVSGYINARMDIVQLDTAAAAPNDAAVVSRTVDNLKVLSFYFADADNGEYFRKPAGTIGVAFQANTVDDMTAVTIDSSDRIIFNNSGGNDAGWLHCLCRGTVSTKGTTTGAPVDKGTAGYVEPARGIYLNHKHATPNTLTSGRPSNKLGLRLRIFPFTPTNTSDRWKATTAGYYPGIVAVACQSNVATDLVATTLDASGDVIFTSAAGAADVVWLWAWSR